MTYTYRTSGACFARIDLALENSVHLSAAFTGICNGNLLGIAGTPARRL